MMDPNCRINDPELIKIVTTDNSDSAVGAKSDQKEEKNQAS